MDNDKVIPQWHGRACDVWAFKNMTADEYHASDELSSGGLKRFIIDGPTDYHAEKMGWLPPIVDPDKYSCKFDEGTLTHAEILEPHRVDEMVAEIPPTWIIEAEGGADSHDGIKTEVDLLKRNGARNTRGADNEQAWREFREANPGKMLLKPDEIAKTKGMARAIEDHLGALLQTGEHITEPSIFWEDDLGACRARPDFLLFVGDRAVIIDVKTTKSRTQKDFRKIMRNLGYIWQDTHYTAGVKEAFGVADVEFVFVGVHNPNTKTTLSDNYPYKVWSSRFRDEDRVKAHSRWVDAREDIKAREASGDWTDPGAGEIDEVRHYFDDG